MTTITTKINRSLPTTNFVIRWNCKPYDFFPVHICVLKNSFSVANGKLPCTCLKNENQIKCNYLCTGGWNYKRDDSKWADSIPFPSNSETRSVEWTQDWKMRPWKEIFRQQKYCLERKRKENTPAQSARIQTVRDSDGTSIQKRCCVFKNVKTPF